MIFYHLCSLIDKALENAWMDNNLTKYDNKYRATSRNYINKNVKISEGVMYYQASRLCIYSHAIFLIPGSLSLPACQQLVSASVTVLFFYCFLALQ